MSLHLVLKLSFIKKNIKIQDLMKTMNEILEITEQIFTKHLNQKNNKRR